MQSMACLGYVLSMPPCKMAMKSSNGATCCCQYRSCCGLAERNVRLADMPFGIVLRTVAAIP